MSSFAYKVDADLCELIEIIYEPSVMASNKSNIMDVPNVNIASFPHKSNNCGCSQEADVRPQCQTTIYFKFLKPYSSSLATKIAEQEQVFCNSKKINLIVRRGGKSLDPNFVQYRVTNKRYFPMDKICEFPHAEFAVF